MIEIDTDGVCRGNPGIGGWGHYCAVRVAFRRLMAQKNILPIISWSSRRQPRAQVPHTRMRRDAVDKFDVRERRYYRVDRQLEETQVDELANQHSVQSRWVKGHASDEGNEAADRLVHLAIDKMLESSW